MENEQVKAEVPTEDIIVQKPLLIEDQQREQCPACWMDYLHCCGKSLSPLCAECNPKPTDKYFYEARYCDECI